MKRSHLVLLAVFLFLTVFTASIAGAQSFKTKNNVDISYNGQPCEMDEKFTDAGLKFSFDLFAKIFDGNKQSNLFISPYSVFHALLLARSGAQDDTLKAMDETLGLSGLEALTIYESVTKLNSMTQKADPEKVELSVANSLWLKKGDLKFLDEFISVNKKYFDAEVSMLDFDPAAVATMNKWVSDKTRGRITDILKEISPDAIAFLINAIYFKGKWSNEFDKALTKEDVFTTAAGAKIKHSMMSDEGSFFYHEDEDVQLISLPYGNGTISMYVFLPAEKSGLEKFQKTLNFETWKKYMGLMQKKTGKIVLPRFKMDYSVSMSDTLKAMGMGLAFDELKANFRKIAIPPPNYNICISRVIHKAFVEVNEEGTEAAAATVVEMSRPGSAPGPEPPKPFEMIVNRPFLFTIVNNQTHSILFIGTIAEPK